MAVSFLLALAAFPLAFLSCVLVRHYRDIGRSIAAFFRHDAEAAMSAELPATRDAADSADAGPFHAAYEETLTQLPVEIERLKEIAENNSEHFANTDRDFLHVLDVVVFASGYNIISDLLDHRPEMELFIDQTNVTPQWLSKQKMDADDYLMLVMRS